MAVVLQPAMPFSDSGYSWSRFDLRPVTLAAAVNTCAFKYKCLRTAVLRTTTCISLPTLAAYTREQRHREGDAITLLMHTGMASTLATLGVLSTARRSAGGPRSSTGDRSGEIGCSATRGTVYHRNIINNLNSYVNIKLFLFFRSYW